MRAAVINAVAVAIRQHHGIQQQVLSICNCVRINLPVQKKKIENILLAISHCISQADHPSRFFRDSPGLGYSVPESRTLSSGCQNVPVWLQKSRAGQNAIQVINYFASFCRFCYTFTLKRITQQ